MTTKEINREGDRAMYRVWRYLVAVNYSSPFITLPDVGGGAGQMSFTRAVYHYFTRQRPQEVLIMGGIDSEGRNKVTKMIVKRGGRIHFEDCTPMLHGHFSHSAVYHQGEVLSIDDSEQMERLDTLTQAQTLLQAFLPTDVRIACSAMLDNKLYVISESRDVYTLEEHASQAAHGVWRKHEARTIEDRNGGAAIAFEGKLYLCGGISKLSIEVFDPAVGTWQLEVEGMTRTRTLFSLFVFEDEIYAVDGDNAYFGNKTTTIEKRNKDTKRWELVTDCGQDRVVCAVALVGSKVFLFGGGSSTISRDSRQLFTFDFFDLHNKKWASQGSRDAYSNDHDDEDEDDDDESSDEEDEDEEDEDVPNSERRLPRKVYNGKAVLITPPAAKTKKWTGLNVVKLEDRNTARFDERFEATTGKAIAIPNFWDE